MIRQLILFCLLVVITGCTIPKKDMTHAEISSLRTTGKIIVDESQDEQERVIAVEEYCEIVSKLLSRGNVRIQKRFILQSLDIDVEDQNSDFLYSFRLKQSPGGTNCYFMSLMFEGESLVKIEHGAGFE